MKLDLLSSSVSNIHFWGPVEHHKLMDFNNMELQVICLSRVSSAYSRGNKLQLTCRDAQPLDDNSSCVSWLLSRGKMRLSFDCLCLKPVSKQRRLQSVWNSFTGIRHVILVIIWQLTEETRSHFYAVQCRLGWSLIAPSLFVLHEFRKTWI